MVTFLFEKKSEFSKNIDWLYSCTKSYGLFKSDAFCYSLNTVSNFFQRRKFTQPRYFRYSTKFRIRKISVIHISEKRVVLT